ncbi:hypothetical protein GCM10027610_084110 [Dactylosporangium cerinum]
MVDQRGPGVTEAGQDVHDAGGHAGLEQELTEAQGGQRGLLGRLEDDGVARGDGRDDLEAGHQQGKFHGTMPATTPTASRRV